jgi:hypothetical protein
MGSGQSRGSVERSAPRAATGPTEQTSPVDSGALPAPDEGVAGPRAAIPALEKTIAFLEHDRDETRKAFDVAQGVISTLSDERDAAVQHAGRCSLNAGHIAAGLHARKKLQDELDAAIKERDEARAASEQLAQWWIDQIAEAIGMPAHSSPHDPMLVKARAEALRRERDEANARAAEATDAAAVEVGRWVARAEGARVMLCLAIEEARSLLSKDDA